MSDIFFGLSVDCCYLCKTKFAKYDATNNVFKSQHLRGMADVCHPYRIALSPWIFAVAGSACLIIFLLTVIIQSWRTASENPVNNIKTE